jgi:glycosyltransferase involved in cell wall biosynthesis
LSQPPSISILADRIPWFGRHSGYELLVPHLQALRGDVRVTRSRTTWNQIRLGRAYAWLTGSWRRRDYVFAAAELRFALATRSAQGVRHILYAEGHHRFLESWRAAPPNVIGTLHHPPDQWEQWPPAMVRNLGRLSSAIVLYRADVEAFERLVGYGRVKFVRHGVDTEFFRPAANPRPNGTPRVLFAGQNGRNTRMLERVLTRLAERHPSLRFDLLVREQIRQFEGLRELVGHPRVTWHADLDDRTLLRLYQTSTLMLLPFQTCGASNALVEALSCGLPVVTTDVGGVRDYGGAALYPVVANDDDDAMVALVERYLADATWRHAVGAHCRAFAERELAWPIIARHHLKAYTELLG